MKTGWTKRPIGELCEIVGGGTPSKSNAAFFGGDIPWATVRDMRSDWIEDTEVSITAAAVKASATNILPASTVVIASRVGLGKVCRVTQDTAINQDLRGFIPKPKSQLEADYLFWWLKLVATEIVAAGRGATVQGVTLPFLRALEIPLPPLEEQRQIVAVLDEAFAGIATATANSQKNLTNARALFDAELAAILNTPGDDWTMKSIDEVAILSRGQNPPKSKFSYAPKEGYVRFYQIRDGTSEANAVYVPDNSQIHRVEKDDILMVAYRHVGRVFRGVSGAFNVALCKIQNRDRNIIHDDYLFNILPTDLVRGELLKRAERSLIPSMSVHHLKEIIIPVPPIEVQNEIVIRINLVERACNELRDLYSQKLEGLIELKQGFLQRAFAGELT